MKTLGCIQDSDCHNPRKFCNSYHVCEDKLCPSPTDMIQSARQIFNSPEPKIGSSTQMICNDGTIYYLGKTDISEGIPVKQVNLHCVLGSREEPRYIDDFGHTPIDGCTKGIILSYS